jgi:muramoyltetrapeptide carboxypeptidase
VKTPILTGLPFGHVPTKLCLPVGKPVTLLREGQEAFLLWAHPHHGH